jgi:hypothetical protein
MNARHYHNPPTAVSTRARCPVCHQAAYSAGGIHPQCAVKLSDPPRPKAAQAVVDPSAEPVGSGVFED